MDTQRGPKELRRSELAAILETVASQLPPASLPSQWRNFALAKDCFRGADDPALISALLCRKFSESSLIASRVVIRDETGRLTLTGELSGKHHAVVLLRKANGTAFEMLTDSGCLSGSVPLFRLWHDAVFKEDVKNSPQRTVYGVSSLLDFLILRSLGVAGALVTGLDGLSESGLRKFLRLVGASLVCSREWMQRCPKTGRLLRPVGRYRLLLVAASIANLNRTSSDDFEPVVRHLNYAERELEMSFENLYVWSPSDEYFASLQHSRQLGDPGLLRRAVQQSQPVYLLNKFVKAPPRTKPPSDVERYLTCRAEIESLSRKVSSGQAGRQIWSDAVESFLRVGQETLIKPLLKESFSSSDPVTRILGVHLAETARRVHLLTPLADADLQRRLRQGDVVSKPHNFDSLNELPRHTNELLKLVREYRKRDSWKGWAK